MKVRTCSTPRFSRDSSNSTTMSFLFLSRRLLSRGPDSRNYAQWGAALRRDDQRKASADIGVADPDLVRLASVVADWANEVPHAEVYLYGSRARGDHEPGGDVDLCFAFPVRDAALKAWWELNQLTHFALLELKLGERVHALPLNDPMGEKIRQVALDPHNVVHQDRNVFCVWLPKSG